MDSVVGWFFLLALLIVGYYWGLVVYDSNRKNQKHHNDAWETLALANRLEFIPALSSEDHSSIRGEYRGYLLELITVQKEDLYGQYEGIQATTLTLSKKLYQPPLARKESITFENAVSNFTSLDPQYPLTGKVDAWPGGHQIHYWQDGLEVGIDKLQYLFDLLADLADAYPVLLASGGKAVPFLQNKAKLALVKGNNSLQPITKQLLEEITLKTLALEEQISHFLCTRCLARCDAHRVDLLPLESITYYGCRICGESQQLMTWAGSVVAVLDSKMEGELFKDTRVLRVNWLVRRALFDFEAVEIIQATDEDVERFAIQVGNDTDKLRQARYKDMTCTILQGCELSENTVRVLHRIFGYIEVEQFIEK